MSNRNRYEPSEGKFSDRNSQNLDGECRCPNCGHREPSQITIPCYTRSCPKCGSLMTRA
jgi:hypothetical protein